MADEKTDIEKSAGGTAAEHTRSERHYTPAVDIYETDGSLVLVADMPGVSRQDVEVDLEKGVLSIFGKTRPKSLDQGYTPIAAEFEPGHWHRRFQLGDRIDAERIEASMDAGVLRLVLPKVSEARSRKIEIKAG
jgi:HSP20 family molecular chaperone IbpA